MENKLTSNHSHFSVAYFLFEARQEFLFNLVNKIIDSVSHEPSKTKRSAVQFLFEVNGKSISQMENKHFNLNDSEARSCNELISVLNAFISLECECK